MHNVYGGMFSVSKRYDSGRVWNARNKPRTVAPLVEPNHSSTIPGGENEPPSVTP